jgi:hypothetical protein
MGKTIKTMSENEKTMAEISLSKEKKRLKTG